MGRQHVYCDRLLGDRSQAPGANMLITASQENSGDKALLGATVAMEKVRFPVLMQVFSASKLGF